VQFRNKTTANTTRAEILFMLQILISKTAT
jgi:hypothetical protein